VAAFDIRSGKDIGAAISDIRHRQGRSQVDAAEAAGLSRDYLAQIERGRTTSLLEHQLRVLRRLGATITVTFDDDRA
jgi:transcriptional regulator with XRE-family HTH domain